MTKTFVRVSVFLALVMGAQTLSAADKFSQAEVQMVRSVLERQNTLIHLNMLALPHVTTESIRELIKHDNEDQATLRVQLVTRAAAIGMSGVDDLQAPPYFQRVESQLQTLSGTAFEQQYLLLALQCHAFLERSLNAELRSGGNGELLNWIKDHIETFEQQSRSIDHALYDLK